MIWRSGSSFSDRETHTLAWSCLSPYSTPRKSRVYLQGSWEGILARGLGGVCWGSPHLLEERAGEAEGGGWAGAWGPARPSSLRPSPAALGPGDEQRGDSLWASGLFRERTRWSEVRGAARVLGSERLPARSRNSEAECRQEGGSGLPGPGRPGQDLGGSASPATGDSSSRCSFPCPGAGSSHPPNQLPSRPSCCGEGQ